MIAERVRARCAIGKPADGQPVASELSILPFDVSACCHVRIIAATATLARVQRACQAFSARVHVFVCMASAASAGMAVAGASPVRDMPNCSLCNSFLCGTKRAACILCCAALRCATPPSPPPLHEQPEDSERSSYSERDTTHTHPSCQATHESTRSVLKKTRKDVAVLKQQQEVYYKLKKPPHSR